MTYKIPSKFFFAAISQHVSKRFKIFYSSSRDKHAQLLCVCVVHFTDSCIKLSPCNAFITPLFDLSFGEFPSLFEGVLLLAGTVETVCCSYSRYNAC